MIKYGSKIYVLCGAIFSLVGFPFLSIGLHFATHMDELGFNRSGNFWLLPILFIFLGGISTALGIWLNYQIVKQRREIIEHGKSVMAEIIDIVEDYQIMVNHRPTYRVECVYEDPYTGESHTFYSENITFAQAGCIPRGSIRVFVNRNGNYGEYFVDLDSVLKREG